MRLAQLDDIVQVEFGKHEIAYLATKGDYIMGWYNAAKGAFMLTQANLEIPVLISRIVVLIIAFAVHEFSHAWTADYFGDDTPRSQGRLTLNPMAHLDPVGSLLLLVFGFGWARPVMVDPFRLGRRNFMLVALVGPLSNLVLAVSASAIVWLGIIPISHTAPGAILPSALDLIDEFVWINLLLMLFNLIPIAPLDGEKIITYFLPPNGQDFMDRIRPYGMMILMAVIFILPGAFRFIIGTPLNILYQLIFVAPNLNQLLQGSLLGLVA